MSESGSANEANALRYRDADARRSAVAQLVRQRGFCRVADLSDHLGVSRITVRRDIAQLERDGLVRAAHGGVVALGSPSTAGSHFRVRSGSNASAKRAIASKAVELVSDAPIGLLGIDAGTTGFECARLMDRDEPLTVITHSLPVMIELADKAHIEVVGIGGVLHPETQAFAGPTTVAAYGRVRLHTLFLTASAVRADTMYCGNAFDADTKRQMMSVADRTILLVDSSKFEAVAPFQVETLASVDMVILDHQAPEELQNSLAGLGLDVVMADPE